MRCGYYGDVNRRTLLATAALSCSLWSADSSARDVKTVYVLKMRNGLDQFLASELTQQGVYTVTADPKEADAILTEAIGETFEHKMNELFPPPKPVKAADAAKEEKKDGNPMVDALTSDDAASARMGTSTWGRGKGTLFLVDRKTRAVLWSTHGQPKNTRVDKIADHAVRLVRGLKQDIGLAAKP